MEREKAVKTAIETCIKDGVLVEYLENNASEVINMLFGEWNWDDAKTVWAEEAKNEEREKWQAVVLDKDKSLTDKDKTLADNEKVLADNKKVLADNKKALADNKKALADKDAEIAELKSKLGIV